MVSVFYMCPMGRPQQAALQPEQLAVRTLVGDHHGEVVVGGVAGRVVGQDVVRAGLRGGHERLLNRRQGKVDAGHIKALPAKVEHPPPQPAPGFENRSRTREGVNENRLNRLRVAQADVFLDRVAGSALAPRFMRGGPSCGVILLVGLVSFHVPTGRMSFRGMRSHRAMRRTM